MPTDVSRSRDGENQRSDQSFPRRDASPKSGQIRDHVIHQFQLYEQQHQAAMQQREGKGLAPAEVRTGRAIAENGKLVKRQIVLSRHYGRDNPGLPGGAKDITLINLAGARRKILDDFCDYSRSSSFARESDELCTNVSSKVDNIREKLGQWNNLQGNDREDLMKKRFAKIMLD